jgi:deoxyribonuclease V
MYKAALDVYYRDHTAKAVALLFRHWTDEKPSATYSKEIDPVEAYEPGRFYKRELPCLLLLLEEMDLRTMEVLLIDGYVYLDENGRYGLGGYLYEALNRAVPVIGIAKTSYYSRPKNIVALKRGKSNRPLYITAIGMDVEKAARCLESMAGGYRIPKLLRQLDQLTRR